MIHAEASATIQKPRAEVFAYTLRFESLGCATRFTRVVDIEPTGIARLFAPMTGRMVAGRNATLVSNARRQLEGR